MTFQCRRPQHKPGSNVISECAHKRDGVVPDVVSDRCLPFTSLFYFSPPLSSVKGSTQKKDIF